MRIRGQLKMCMLLALTFWAANVQLSSASVESDANSVEIKVYPADLSDWTTTVEDWFTGALANQMTVYCTSNMAECGLDSAATFSRQDVTIHSKAESSKSLKLSIYVSYPTGSNITSGGSTTEIIPSSAVKAVLKDMRNSVKDQIDKYVTHIGDEYFGVPIESTANRIIIPIAFVTVIAVGISASVMVHVQECQEKKARQEERLARKKALKTLPNYEMAAEPDSFTSGGGGKGEGSQIMTPRGGAKIAPLPESVVYGRTKKNHNADKPTKLSTRTSNNTTNNIIDRDSSHHDNHINQQPEVYSQSPNNYFHSNGTNTLPPLPPNDNDINNINNISNSNNTTTTTVDFHTPREGQNENENGEEEDRRRARKEKKREKRRLKQERQAEARLEQAVSRGAEKSAMTNSEASGYMPGGDDVIPTFTVHRGGAMA